MSVPFEMPLIYPCRGIPPRKRVSRPFNAMTTATFTMPEAEPDELEPALVFHRREERDGKVYENAIEVMQCRGMLVRPQPAYDRSWDETPLTQEDLSALAAVRPRDLPRSLWPDSGRYAYEYSSEVERADRLNPAKMEGDSFRETHAALQSKIDANLVLVDGTVYARAADPSWNFYAWGREGWKAQALLIPDSTFAFPGDSREPLDRFSEWCRDRFGQSVETDPCTWIERRTTEIPFSGNPIVRAASSFANRARLNVVNHDAFGSETKRLGVEFRDGASVASALAFMAAFEEAASEKGAEHVFGGLDNREWFEMFWKFYELVPDGYKLDPADERLGDDQEPDFPTP